jgi:hypothetical protein
VTYTPDELASVSNNRHGIRTSKQIAMPAAPHIISLSPPEPVNNEESQTSCSEVLGSKPAGHESRKRRTEA